MFGNNMMGKLQEMKQKMDEIKSRLDSITVTGESGNGAVKVIVTGNKKVKEIQISDDLMQEDKELLEDYLILATNHALEQAEKVHDAEMKGAASGMLPGMF